MPTVRSYKVIPINSSEILEDWDGKRFLRLTPIVVEAFREAIDSPSGIKNPPSRNKPLAQGKPVSSRATGNASKGRKQTGKGTKPKRGG